MGQFWNSWFFVFVILVIWNTPESKCEWLRSALIYHDGTRQVDNFERQFMRIDNNGQFTGQWLFDHAILTSNGNKIAYGGMEGQDFINLLTELSGDASKIDAAIGALLSSFNPPATGFLKISIAFPYIDSLDRIVSVEAQQYHLSIQQDRLNLVTWYVDKVRQIRSTGGFKNLEIIGLYYHREDAIDVNGDLEMIKHFNRIVHEFGMKSVWVPYYNAPHNWEGKYIGFDKLVVQPGYSFASIIDDGSVTGDRLHSIGQMSATRSQCFEYELRGNGQSQLEHWIAHQYLAVAQLTGAWRFPQVFFVGANFFDKVTNKSAVSGDTWNAYSDLADYLNGQTIDNLETEIPFSIEQFTSGNIITAIWVVPIGYSGLTSIRLDFNDNYSYWKGRLIVKVSSPNGQVSSSFSQRWGMDLQNPNYEAVFVPIADKTVTEGSQITIELTKEGNSSWPNIIRLVASKFEPPQIANPIYQETSSASKTVSEGPYADSQPTYKQYAAGKLTDGQMNNNGWDWSGVMGWSLIPEGVFSVTIDLGVVTQNISNIKIWSYYDEGAAVAGVDKIMAMSSINCAPHLRGTLGLSCLSTASSGPQETSISGPRQLINLQFDSDTSARYITITGVPLAWFLVDEIQVLNLSNLVVSLGKPYKVTPIPGDQETGPAYADNDRRLVDGAVFKDFVFGRGNDGLNANTDNCTSCSVETIWDEPKLVTCAKVWTTEADAGFGIEFPQEMEIQVRNEIHVWSSGINVSFSLTCGPAPCAKLCFSNKTALTGVRGIFSNFKSWIMVSEISVE